MTNSKRSRAAVGLALATTCASSVGGCRNQVVRSESVIVRDSAGIKIIESLAPAWDSATAWRVAAAPTLEVAETDPIERVAATIQLSDGRVVVAERGENVIRVYSPTGQLVSRFGRRGQGPGEFRDISRLYRLGSTDSLLVFDLLLNRASVFDAEGRLQREFSTREARGGLLPTIAGLFRDGSLLMADVSVPTPDLRGLIRSDVTLRRYDPSVDQSVILASVPGRETYFQDTPWGQVDMRQPYFGYSAAYLAGGVHAYWAISDTFAIHVLDESGAVSAVIRRRQDVVRPSSSDVDRIITRQLSGVTDGNARTQARRMLENMPISDRAPAFGWPAWASSYGPVLQLDEDGNLWVVVYDPSDEGRNARHVFSTEGIWLGDVELPPRFAPGQIGTEYMAGVQTDSLDVEHVRVYRLIKP